MSRNSTLAFFMLLLGSCGSSQPCILPPPTTTEEDRSIAVKLGAELEKLPVAGDVETEFKNKLKSEFGAMSDANVSLYLFLSAIHCLVKEGDVGQGTAETLAAAVKQRWASEHGLLGTGDKLSPLEKRLIRESGLEQDLTRLLAEFGFSI